MIGIWGSLWGWSDGSPQRHRGHGEKPKKRCVLCVSVVPYESQEKMRLMNHCFCPIVADICGVNIRWLLDEYEDLRRGFGRGKECR